MPPSSASPPSPNCAAFSLCSVGKTSNSAPLPSARWRRLAIWCAGRRRRIASPARTAPRSTSWRPRNSSCRGSSWSEPARTASSSARMWSSSAALPWARCRRWPRRPRSLPGSPRAAEEKAWPNALGIADGVVIARDLVNEPANVLYPAEFARRTSSLSKLGVNVEVLDVAAMKKLGMGALLGVGQGSVHESKVVVMRWNGGKRGAAPVAFIGKGVCFDSGGISIKPASGMEDMKGDMACAGCVVGLMHALAARKAKVNAVGAIGLVENMPDGKAQRPGDIVKTMSGQTIEIINTDAEGRLVLADVLHYVNKRFKPKFMINLATLTGAIIVALGQEYAGMFCNDDKLAERLTKAGEETGERVWRMPLGAEYDKQIDSKFADMKNTGGRWGGAITAAQLLQRFVNKTPWAHLDIAGTALGSPQTDINKSWSSGWGVRLLDRLVEDSYERRFGTDG